MTDDFNMYDYDDHVVQIIKKDGNTIIGWVYNCETDFDNDIGDALDIATGYKHIPEHISSHFPLEPVFVSDIQSIDIIE